MSRGRHGEAVTDQRARLTARVCGESCEGAHEYVRSSLADNNGPHVGAPLPNMGRETRKADYADSGDFVLEYTSMVWDLPI